MLRREKRQVRRILVAVDAEVKVATPAGIVANPAPMRGVVTNLSTTGLSMRLPEVQPIGTLVRISVTLKDTPSFFFAAVRRVYPATAYHPNQFGHGLQIVAAPEESIDAIYEYMMTITGRASQIETTNVVEAFPAAVNGGSGSTKSDPPSSGSQATSPEPLATLD